MTISQTHYTCYRTPTPPAIDGKLGEVGWQLAPKSPRFVDMVTGAPGFFGTQAAALWDDDYFYVGFWVEEPFVTAQLTQHDSLIFQENDVEAFIDGGDCYYEFEINALGTIYEVFFIWQDAYQAGKFPQPEFDVLKQGGLSFGGNHDRTATHFGDGTHSRGLRWAFHNWDLPGLKWTVHVDGHINSPNVVDKGWTVELAFPWAGMQALAGGRAISPQHGDQWRIFFGRFQCLNIGGQSVNPAWAWTPIGSGDNHLPEKFMVVKSDAR